MARENSQSPSDDPPALYRADGGYTVSGLAVLGLIGFLTAMALGLLQGFLISKRFNIFVVSAVCFGYGLGYLQSLSVKACKVRSRVFCGAAAVLLGGIVTICTHFSQYVVFEWNLARVPATARLIARDFVRLNETRQDQPVQVQQLLDELAKDKTLRETLAVDGFFSYVDLMAHRGLRVVDQKQPNREPLNLGYVGTVAYWEIEMLVISGIVFGLTISKASQPYCLRCHSWKIPLISGFVFGIPKKSKQALLSGDLSEFDPSREIEPRSRPIRATLLTCPDCSSSDRIEVRLENVIPYMGWNGKPTARLTGTICTVSYPGNAITAISTLLQAPNPQQAVTAALRANDSRMGRSMNLFGWMILGFAGLLFCGSAYFCWKNGQFSPVGFVISLVLGLCGGGLCWVAKRESQRH